MKGVQLSSRGHRDSGTTLQVPTTNPPEGHCQAALGALPLRSGVILQTLISCLLTLGEVTQPLQASATLSVKWE